MNEQLIVKNFGPIKDATVDFKRVTVFIGPTGGGKSTLAKLAAVFKNNEFYRVGQSNRFNMIKNYSLTKFFSDNTDFKWTDKDGSFLISRDLEITEPGVLGSKKSDVAIDLIYEDEEKRRVFERVMESYALNLKMHSEGLVKSNGDDLLQQLHELLDSAKPPLVPSYIPAERIFVSSIEYSWPGLLRDNIGLPKSILDFSNSFSLSRKNVPELNIKFLKAKYIHSNGQDLVKIDGSETLFRLYETASGIQSVTPLLVLLEHLSRNTEQAQSFIIEEPELNLYPTAQQGLLNWLVEKCTQGENDLTITTHSPYILSHLNLLLYAYQVAEKHPDRKEAVAAIVPEASWINSKEFACYQVENGGVQSLVDEELGLIDNNELDGLSGDAADAFDNLIRLSKGFATK